ncbi:MAG: methylamine utilization protein [Massilia sp.]
MITAVRAAAAFVAVSLTLSAQAGAAALAVSVIDGDGKPLADTVVYVELDGAVSAPRNPKPAEIEQRGLKFLPLVSVIQAGAQIAFPNNDKVRHHIYSFSPAKKFDQKLYSGVAAAPQVFDKAGTVVLGCNIHDRMIAYVKVLDTPYFAKTDAAGVARIELPAAAKGSLKAWHFNMQGAAPAELSVNVKAGESPTPASFKLPLKPRDETAALAGQ